jgi:hypothetical protein
MIARGFWHQSITTERIIEACHRRMTTLDNPGFCLVCGIDVEGVEPDARNGTCDACGAPHVFGSDELAIIIA